MHSGLAVELFIDGFEDPRVPRRARHFVFQPADHTVQVWTLYGADGLPELIVDEIDGWQIQGTSNTGEFGAWAVYDKLAMSQGSWVVTDYEEDEGVMKIGRITGRDGTTASVDNIQELPPTTNGWL